MFVFIAIKILSKASRVVDAALLGL